MHVDNTESCVGLYLVWKILGYFAYPARAGIEARQAGEEEPKSGHTFLLEMVGGFTEFLGGKQIL